MVKKATPFLFGSLIVVGLLAVDRVHAQQTIELLKNRSFTRDSNGIAGWQIGDGAGRGSVESTLQTRDGELELSGNARTELWKFVAQTIDVQAGDYVRLTYEARAMGLRKERGQFDNCYVGLKFSNRSRGNVGITFFPVTEKSFAKEFRLARVPDGATTTAVMIFLSKTGRLSVQNVSAQRVNASQSFDLLVEQMGRYYSYFDHKKIDWESLVQKYRARANDAIPDRAQFEAVVLEMLSELKDGHVWLIQNGNRVPAWTPGNVQRNVDFRVVQKRLRDVKSFGPIGFAGRIKDHNIGYVAVTSLDTTIGKFRPLLQAIGRLYDTDGMIVDLRGNSGGNEAFGRLLAGVFCKKPVPYAVNRFRRNQKPDEFIEYPRGPLIPIRGRIFERPVVALIGPGAVSSAEGTALMFQALPNATLIGQPTRGSSGNPAGVTLPNKTEVWFSRWVACDASGQPIEDRGVQPDIRVAHDSNDPALIRAIQELTP